MPVKFDFSVQKSGFSQNFKFIDDGLSRRLRVTKKPSEISEQVIFKNLRCELVKSWNFTFFRSNNLSQIISQHASTYSGTYEIVIWSKTRFTIGSSALMSFCEGNWMPYGWTKITFNFFDLASVTISEKTGLKRVFSANTNITASTRLFDVREIKIGYAPLLDLLLPFSNRFSFIDVKCLLFDIIYRSD
jgi:hypothetical protein